MIYILQQCGSGRSSIGLPTFEEGPQMSGLIASPLNVINGQNKMFELPVKLNLKMYIS